MGHRRLFTVTCLGLVLAAAGLYAQEEKAGFQPPSDKPSAAKPAANGAAGKADAVARRREGLLLLEQAEQKLREGRSQEARKLAERARALYPDSRAIRALLQEFDAAPAERAQRRELTARAHLAAAYFRAQQLLSGQRYAEAVDLLRAIERAVDLFPPRAGVEGYRTSAQQMIEGYERAVQQRLIPSPRATAAKETSEADAKAAGTAPPQNVQRLRPLSPKQVPYWYTQMKTRLSRPMTVNYPGSPLGQVLEEIQKEAGVEVVMDEPVQRAGLAARSAIDLRIRAVPAETILYLATQLSGTEYVLLENRVLITTPEKVLDYVEKLPEVLYDHWLAQRTLFPEQYRSAAPQPKAPVSRQTRVEEELTLPAYLRSGEALLSDLTELLATTVQAQSAETKAVR